MRDLRHSKGGPFVAETRVVAHAVLRHLGRWALVTAISATSASASSLSVEVAPLQQPQLPTLELIQTVGCEACSGPERFGRVVAVAGAPDNSFAVLTAEAPFVRVWNRAAGSVVQFGREGGGPGEMQRAIDVILTPGALQVAAISGTRKHIETFDAEGNHLRSDPTPLSRPYYAFSVFQGSPSGRWGVLWDGYGVNARVLRLEVGTGAVIEIPRPPSLLEGAPVSNYAASNISIAVSDDGTVAMGDGQVDYRLAVFPSGGGAPVLGGRQVAKMERSPWSREEWDRYQQDQLAAARRLNPPNPSLIELIEARQMPTGPRFVPHLSQTFDGALRFDSAGRLWAKTPRGNFSDRTVYDVFDQGLTYLGEVVIPGVTTFWHIGGDQMITAGFNDAGIRIVQVWRLQ